MAIETLKDVYLAQLQDLHSACEQSLEITTELGRAARNESLSEALIAGAEGISNGIADLERLCSIHEVNPAGEHCKGMEGLVKEARSDVLEQDFGDADARDAMIITQYQRMVHYAIAVYGCARAFANRLGLQDDAAVLERCLEHTAQGDRRMTQIATRGGVNAAAAG